MSKTAPEEAVQIPLGNGRTYGLNPNMTEAAMHALATGILTKLGRSYDIKIPGSTGWGGRHEVLRQMAEDSEVYAARKAHEPDDREALAAAYRAGWSASPKPVSYPVQRTPAQ